MPANTEHQGYLNDEMLDEFEGVLQHLKDKMMEDPADPIGRILNVMIFPLLDTVVESVRGTIDDFLEVHGEEVTPAQVVVGMTDMSVAVYDALSDQPLVNRMKGLESLCHYMVASEFVKKLRELQPNQPVASDSLSDASHLDASHS